MTPRLLEWECKADLQLFSAALLRHPDEPLNDAGIISAPKLQFIALKAPD
jgi:hypothetical protein